MRSLALAAVMLASIVAIPTAAAVSVPNLTLVTRTPLVVRGTGFKPSERVTVTAMTLSGPRRVVVRATLAGRLSATIRVVNQPCGRAFAVHAAGGTGSTATLRIAGAPCTPPPVD